VNFNEFLLLIGSVFKERMSKELIAVPTVSGIFFQTTVKEIAKLRRPLFLIQPPGILCCNLVQYSGLLQVDIRWVALSHLDHKNTEGPNIDFNAVLLFAADHLGGHPANSAYFT